MTLEMVAEQNWLGVHQKGLMTHEARGTAAFSEVIPSIEVKYEIRQTEQYLIAHQA